MTEVARGEQDGSETIELRAGGLRAAFAPGVGMVCCSLRHEGDELLGMRGGLAQYAASGSTFGVPLLYPWANRLDGFGYRAAGRDVALDPASPLLHLDENGLPIHGVLAASRLWEVTETAAGDRAASLRARLGFGGDEDVLAAFPYPHELHLDVRLSDVALTIATQVHATHGVPVPVAFGWHPYLTLPGVARSDWEISLPVRMRAVLDERGIPTGAAEPATAAAPSRLGERTFDDLFAELAGEPPTFALRGGGRQVDVRFELGYTVAQVYAPAGEDFICFEPMTAPTNALVSGRGLRTLTAGDRYEASFSITVSA